MKEDRRRALHHQVDRLRQRLAQLRQGQKLSVQVQGKSYAGRVSHMALEAAVDGRYAVDVVFEPQDLLRAGLPAAVELP